MLIVYLMKALYNTNQVGFVYLIRYVPRAETESEIVANGY